LNPEFGIGEFLGCNPDFPWRKATFCHGTPVLVTYVEFCQEFFLKKTFSARLHTKAPAWQADCTDAARIRKESWPRGIPGSARPLACYVRRPGRTDREQARAGRTFGSAFPLLRPRRGGTLREGAQRGTPEACTPWTLASPGSPIPATTTALTLQRFNQFHLARSTGVGRLLGVGSDRGVGVGLGVVVGVAVAVAVAVGVAVAVAMAVGVGVGPPIGDTRTK